MRGGFHHEPRSAGQFVPGLASANLSDRDLPKLSVARTFTNDSVDATGPTPRKMSFASPAPTAKDDAVEALGRENSFGTPSALPPVDNQLGDSQVQQLSPPITPMQAVPAKASPKENEPTPADPKTAAPPDNLEETPQAPGCASASSGQLPSAPETQGKPMVLQGEQPEGKPVVIEGTMYEDGTYWKTLDCSNHDCRTLYVVALLCLMGLPRKSSIPRMDRYMKQAKKGKVQASPEVVKLWGTNVGRDMAQHMFKHYSCSRLPFEL